MKAEEIKAALDGLFQDTPDTASGKAFAVALATEFFVNQKRIAEALEVIVVELRKGRSQ